MNSLRAYIDSGKGTAKSLGERARVSAPMLYQIMAGNRRPSPELARRIEDATAGEVRATQLLGLEEAGSAFDHASPPRYLNGGRWAATVSADGSLLLTPEVVSALGFAAGERVVMRQEEGVVRINSSDKALKDFQDYLQKVGRTGVSLVDELIAERRAEAANE